MDTWFRVENTIHLDPLLSGLTPGQKWAWVCLLAEASRLGGREGYVEQSRKYMLLATGIPASEYDQLLETMMERGEIRMVGDSLFITRFAELQNAHSKNPKALAMRRLREERRSNTEPQEVTSGNVLPEEVTVGNETDTIQYNTIHTPTSKDVGGSRGGWRWFKEQPEEVVDYVVGWYKLVKGKNLARGFVLGVYHEVVDYVEAKAAYNRYKDYRAVMRQWTTRKLKDYETAKGKGAGRSSVLGKVS